MAIYQPTNITPDMVSGPENGVVFVAPGGNVEVSWAVNGNSPLTAYQVEFFKNDAASTAGTSTGKVVLDTPFSPVSADGTESRFSVSLPYGVGGTYFSIAAADANKQGKIRITQWWGDGTGQSVVQRSLSVFRITTATQISISGPVVSGGERTFTGTVTLPSYVLYGDSAVLWARWQIFDADSEDADSDVVQDTGKVWGATSYEWTADALPTGNYFAQFSVATSNGEELSVTGNQFSVYASAVNVEDAITVACDKGNGAVRVTAKDTLIADRDLNGASLTQDDGIIFPEADGFAKWTFPAVSDLDWAFSWRGKVSADGGSPVFRLTLQNGQVVSFGIEFNQLMEVYVPVYVSPAVPFPGQFPQTLEDSGELLVSFGWRSDGTYGWVLGAYDQHGNYEAADWADVAFATSPPVMLELLPGGETRDFCLCFGSDGLQAVEDYVETGYYTQPQGTTIGLNASAFEVKVYLFGPQLSMTVWRQKTGSNALARISDFLSGEEETVFLDYGAANNSEYSYIVVVDTDSGGIIGQSEAITPCFWDWVLIEAQDFGTLNRPEYVAVNVFRFGLNLSSGSNGNGNSPNVLSNFTPYPTVMKDTQNRQSGTLTALIGSITAPGEYTDSNELRDKIRALSVTQNTLFLRNRRGDFMKIAIAGEISTDTADTTHLQQINAVIPWVEIGPVKGSVVKTLSGGGSE